MKSKTIENRINEPYIREKKELMQKEGLTGRHDEKVTKIRLEILEHLFPEDFKIMRRIYENNENLWKNNDINKIHDIVSDISEVYPPIKFPPIYYVLAYVPPLDKDDTLSKIALYNPKSKRLEVGASFDHRKASSNGNGTKIRTSSNVKDIFKDFSIKEVVKTIGVYGALYEHLTENRKFILPQFEHKYPEYFGNLFKGLIYKEPEFQPTGSSVPDFFGQFDFVLEPPDLEKHFWMKPIENKERLQQIIRDPKWFKRAYLLKMFF